MPPRNRATSKRLTSRGGSLSSTAQTTSLELGVVTEETSVGTDIAKNSPSLSAKGRARTMTRKKTGGEEKEGEHSLSLQIMSTTVDDSFAKTVDSNGGCTSTSSIQVQQETRVKRRRVDPGPSEAEILKNTVPFVRCTCDADFHIKKHYKIISWNVNGLGSLSQTDHLTMLVQREKPHILCMQETMLQSCNAEEAALLPGYKVFSTCSTARLGYSGTRTYIKAGLPIIAVHYGLTGGTHNEEGRTITVEMPQFFVVNTYVPNSGIARLKYRTEIWDPALRDYLAMLQKTKPVIWTGDLNVAERDYDRFFHGSYREMSKNACFTPEERISFRTTLATLGMTDTFRLLYPNASKVYSFWSHRHNRREQDKGWRLDYFVTSNVLCEKVVDTFMLQDVRGSDHCPIVLWMHK